jgi:hypothetical protein
MQHEPGTSPGSPPYVKLMSRTAVWHSNTESAGMEYFYGRLEFACRRRSVTGLGVWFTVSFR